MGSEAKSDLVEINAADQILLIWYLCGTKYGRNEAEISDGRGWQGVAVPFLTAENGEGRSPLVIRLENGQ